MSRDNEQLLGCAPVELEACNSFWTAKEVSQQPRVWREAAAAIEADRGQINAWLQPLLALPGLRIILCGAGTSAFVGEALAPWLRQRLGRRIEAVSTTDLVGAPGQYLAEQVPTLMISFARSGDSPESVASFDLANQLLSECYHLVLTCNAQGQLARRAEDNSAVLCRMMPAGTNDRSFAMTSSFSSMLVSCAAIFAPEPAQLECASEMAEQVIDTRWQEIKSLADKDFRRLVVLGGGGLLGMAREAALKFLELTAGQVVSLHDSPLGFRHGPKSVVDDTTLILLLESGDSYSQRYDRDLLAELRRDGQAADIVVLDAAGLGARQALDDLWLSLPYIVYCQMLGFYKALALGIGADNPCPTGEVNRVVQGVTLHAYGEGE